MNSKTHESDTTPIFHQSLQELIARADESNVPTGVLLTLSSGPLGKGILRDGITFSDTIDQRQWEAIYNALAQSTLPNATLNAFKQLHLPPDEKFELSDEMTETEVVVPIGLISVRYQQFTRRVIARIFSAHRNDSEIDVPNEAQLVEECMAFVASALLPAKYWGFERQPDVHAGLDMKFHLDPELMISNTDKPDRIEIDFDDGHGFREMAVGSRQPIHYDEGGEYRIVLRAQYGEEMRTASFLFNVAPVTAPQPDYTFVVRAKIPHNGGFGICRIVGYRGKGNIGSKIIRPFIIAEGFPGGTPISDLYDRINGKVQKVPERWNDNAKLADALRERGHDLLLMLFHDGGAQIQGNAYAYLAALEEIWNRMDKQGEIIAAGGSMGGLIARYALAYAETNNIPTGNVTALMTFDSPHLGANVPLGIQCVTRYFAGDGGNETNKILDLPAARQMLMAQRWTWHQDNEIFEKENFRKFYDELGKLGKDRNGYPAKIKKYAISNGAGAGTSGIQPGTPGVKWWQFGAKAEAWGSPNGTPGTISYCQKVLDFKNYHYDGTNIIYGRDGCSGGTATFFGDMADKFRARGKGTVEEHVKTACFVPAYSALGYPVKDAYAFIPNSLRAHDVPFTACYVGAANAPHATIDKSIKDWVLQRLPSAPNPPELNGWAEDGFPPGSRGWVPGYKVRYSVAYVLKDGSEIRGGWWSSGDGNTADINGYLGNARYTRALLRNISCDPTGQAVARRIYRQFLNWPERMIHTIQNNMDTTWGDSDRDMP